MPGDERKPKKTVGLIEDRQRYRDLFAEMFAPHGDAYEIVTYKAAEEFLRAEDPARLDILLVDFSLPHMNGSKLIEIAHRKYPDLPLVMWTVFADDEVIYQALRAGAVGYFWKNEMADIVANCQMIIDGGAAMSPRIALRVMKSFRGKAQEDAAILTQRERIVYGHSNRKIAEILRITFHTARTHVRNIYRKLEIQNQVQLMRKAADMGLL